jgi:hypothetical protein
MTSIECSAVTRWFESHSAGVVLPGTGRLPLSRRLVCESLFLLLSLFFNQSFFDGEHAVWRRLTEMFEIDW